MWKHPDVPRGGRARSGGHFHLHFWSGSRSRGSSAGASYAYITREKPYDQPERDPVLYRESGHMPSWAEPDPAIYWQAADTYERANARLFVGADFALPRELSADERRDLASTFVHQLTDAESWPFTMAVHEGRGADGEAHNPHVHLMFSERGHDGLDRTPETWFARANREEPDRGGAPKSSTMHRGPGDHPGRDWVEQARSRWAEDTNRALERAGQPTRVDHRSYERQGIDEAPERRIPRGAMERYLAGRPSDRTDEALFATEREQEVQRLDREISRLVLEREIVSREIEAEERAQRPRSQSTDHDRDDSSRGR